MDAPAYAWIQESLEAALAGVTDRALHEAAGRDSPAQPASWPLSPTSTRPSTMPDPSLSKTENRQSAWRHLPQPGPAQLNQTRLSTDADPIAQQPLPSIHRGRSGLAPGRPVAREGYTWASDENS